MITEENNDALENEVQEILEEASWQEPPTPDEGRIEVIAYRACLEAARKGELVQEETDTRSSSDLDPQGQTALSPERLEDDKLDEDPCAGTRV